VRCRAGRRKQRCGTYDSDVARTISPAAIESGTGRSWDDWLKFFTSVGAEHLTHQEIVAKAMDAGAPPWWCQMVSVAYEQHIGRRLPGQDGDGAFAVSASKTRDGTIDEALARWIEVIDDRDEFSGIAISRGPDTSSTEKWRYWRCGLADGSRVVVNISAKSPSKSVVSVQHEKLESDELVAHWRDYWKATLSQL
jgi:hypothetical protein